MSLPKTLIVGNWKMHGTLGETLRMITELHNKMPETDMEVVVAPPFTALYSAYVVLQETNIKLAAQNMHWDIEGPYTGEVSGFFLKDVGCSYVLVGHSERRQFFGETDERVQQKIQAALAQDLIPIFCVGETKEQRQSGKTEIILESQLRKGLQGLPMGDLENLVIAYEPVWAIGTGVTPTVAEIEKALHFIRDTLAKTYDAPTANAMRLLYGGSISPDNASAIFKAKHVNGVLVGGASLVVEKFLKIIRARDAYDERQ